MTDRQKILDEIKRLKEWEPIAIPQAQRRKEIQCARLGVLIGLEDFINSLPAEQDKTKHTNFEVAESEKYSFVTGQFLECRASFNEFEEDNSYWLEYVGDDNYIGRSDNILNQKFHITPRQLFTLFTQEHCPKGDGTGIKEETNIPTGYGKYVDECLNKAAKRFFPNGEDAYSVAGLFHAGVKCGVSLQENASREAITMPLAERIKDKIEQLKEEASYHENVQSVLNKLKVYIDIISTEQPSEELEKAAAALTNEIVGELNVWDYTDHSGHNSHWHSFKEGVVAGAKWQKEQTISKACEWLNKNVVEYHPRKGQLRPIVNINAFREAMEN